MKVMVTVPVKTALALQYAVMNSVVSATVPSAPPWIILQGQTRGEREGESHQDPTPHGQFPVRRREGFPAIQGQILLSIRSEQRGERLAGTGEASTAV